ncbi:MAG: hypothetical protein COT85_03955 [Chlamydiae bacterium CG10_big_fil_rev_8_21_14_0_10_42_34]|nr:MAG: hypothetical protein COT85_03955 [Chlamydiae bacterium CG10_big_fil_rev_8_21_14_0_10_42_34]
MIECILLSTSAGNFYAHHFQGKSDSLLVFIPGLMEPKAGLFYIWNEMASDFYNKGHSCLLFDLAGQGDSLLPFSFDLWVEQRNAILNEFKDKNIHFIARGIGTILLTSDQINIAIYPSLFAPVAKQSKCIRWAQSSFHPNFITPAEPQALSDIEKDFFHRLGAEAECIGGLQVPSTFNDDLLHRLPHKLPDNVFCYEAEEDHPLFDKQSQRDALLRAIAKDLDLRIS